MPATSASSASLDRLPSRSFRRRVSVPSRLATIAMTLGLGAWPATQAAAPSHAQGEQPVFRGGVELIQLDVSVLDRNRQPVTGLNASDFTVFENGVQRPVRAFTSVQLPARRPDAGGAGALPATVPVNVVTNEVAQQEGRLVINLMDRTIPTGQP